MAKHETAESKPARRATRAERLGFRVDPQTKRLIEKAARLERRKLTEYCLKVLTEAARHTIEEHELIVLTERDRKLVFEALMNPPEPNERLRRAFEEHGRRVAP